MRACCSRCTEPIGQRIHVAVLNHSFVHDQRKHRCRRLELRNVRRVRGDIARDLEQAVDRLLDAGYGDLTVLDIAEAALLDLTTVRVAQQEMGARAAQLLIARLEGEPIPEPRIVLEAELVVRGSTGGAQAARRIA